ncbi:Similar to PPAF2: Phenoloxidase-activating factor 2 (Holotrichia diomphalia) [Cotesia congregata]|uniref:Similar to PPAF2: Phenoloxidase-activating factor 2 (Holotrichia diomphalia) n=1 Tax=Cotesia congregata TaxID=51543 RepID=A0A8J2H5I8_COTCN|nr:Similar to PPAF2: Phenoloxidase-activating factor 2 (Holotrichia diomphalia) [Cotesia congregata]
MASIAWIIFGTILIINSATSIVQNFGSNRKCHCGYVENFCSANLQLFNYLNNHNCYSYSPAYCPDNKVRYCSIPDGSISETCGMKKMTVMTKKINGQSQVGEHPWQAAILTSNGDGNYKYKGAGALIHKKHVITVVQNVETGDVIRLGEWDLLSNQEICSQQDYQAKKIIKHPGFNTDTMENNIALIILDRNVPLATSPHISTACLSSSTPSFGSRCWIAGWGGCQQLTPGTTKRLRDVNIPIVNRWACQQSIQNFLTETYELPESIFCAGEGKMDSCMIDGGAPLVCESASGRMEVVGLVSASVGCQQNVPSLFTDVSKFTSWIHKQVFEHC